MNYLVLSWMLTLSFLGTAILMTYTKQVEWQLYMASLSETNLQTYDNWMNAFWFIGFFFFSASTYLLYHSRQRRLEI